MEDPDNLKEISSDDGMTVFSSKEYRAKLDDFFYSALLIFLLPILPIIVELIATGTLSKPRSIMFLLMYIISLTASLASKALLVIQTIAIASLVLTYYQILNKQDSVFYLFIVIISIFYCAILALIWVMLNFEKHVTKAGETNE